MGPLDSMRRAMRNYITFSALYHQQTLETYICMNKINTHPLLYVMAKFEGEQAFDGIILSECQHNPVGIGYQCHHDNKDQLNPTLLYEGEETEVPSGFLSLLREDILTLLKVLGPRDVRRLGNGQVGC